MLTIYLHIVLYTMYIIIYCAIIWWLTIILYKCCKIHFGFHWRLYMYMPRIYRVMNLVMVFNATFNNISVISWRSGGNRSTMRKTALSQFTDKFNPSPWARFELTTLVAIDIDCIASCKSSYHTITTTTFTGYMRVLS